MAVRKVCRGGHRVIMDENESAIQNKANGMITPVYHRDGVYHVALWVQAMSEKEEEANRLFRRQGA